MVEIDKQDEKSQQDESRLKMASLKRLGLLTFALIIIAIALLLIPKPSNPVKKCLSITFQQNKGACLYNLAVSSNNASICSYISQSSGEAQCYAKIGVDTLSTKTCSASESINGSAYSYCISYIANRTSNASMCAEVHNDSCITAVGMRLYNQSVCGLIQNQSNASVCASSVGIEKALGYANESYCQNISPTPNSTILPEIASNIKLTALLGASSSNSMLMDELSLIPSMLSSPRDICYLALAARSDNASYCSGINSTGVREICQSTISPVSLNVTYNYTQLLSFCKNTTYSSLCSEISKFALTITKAVQTKNATLCGTLNTTASWECYASMAKALDNASYCGYISNSTYNSACIFNLSNNSTST